VIEKTLRIIADGVVMKHARDQWVRGNYNGYLYAAKVYNEPSQFGINEGRVSKFYCSYDGEEVMCYDREWASKPKTTDQYNALVSIVDALEKSERWY
jgi:hypothetical protein